jgi:hypothetical protein
MASNGTIRDKLRTGKNLEGNDHGVIKVLSLYLRRGTAEGQEQYIKNAGVRPKFETNTAANMMYCSIPLHVIYFTSYFAISHDTRIKVKNFKIHLQL